MRTAEGTLSVQLRSAFLSLSASRAASCIFPVAVFPCCLRVWAQESDMKRPFLSFGLCMFNLQLSSICLPCGHLSACMCFFFIFNTKFRTKKPNPDGKKTLQFYAFQQVSLYSKMFIGALAVKCLHLCVPVLSCVCVVLCCVFALSGLILGTGRCTGVWRIETYCCNWQFILHTHPQTDCSQVYTHIQGDRYTHPQTDGSHTPTTEFPFTCIPALPRHYVEQSLQTQKISLWQTGVASIANWRVLIQNYNVSMSVSASEMSMFFYSHQLKAFLLFSRLSVWIKLISTLHGVLYCESKTDKHS